MPGAPIKREKRRIAREAILRAAVDHAVREGWKTGRDPVELMKPVAAALHTEALKGDVGAIREVFDRVEGRVPSREEEGGDTPRLVDMALLGAARALLERIPAPKEPERVEKVIGSGEAEPTGE